MRFIIGVKSYLEVYETSDSTWPHAQIPFMRIKNYGLDLLLLFHLLLVL